MFRLSTVLLISMLMFVHADEVEEIWKLYFVTGTLPEVASQEGETTLVTLVKTAGLATALSTTGEFKT